MITKRTYVLNNSLLVNYKQMITKINENKVHNKLVSGATTNLN